MPRFLSWVVLLSCVTLLSGCTTPLYLPRLGLERIELPLKPPDPVMTNPGGAGPIWATPSVSAPRGCDPCCPPGHPVQPIDPFGWIRFGSMGTQEIDPLGWVFGI